MELEQYKSSAFEIFDRLLRAMRSPEGYVHPQSLLCCIGSLAGYSCQQDVRKLFMTEGVKEEDVFTPVYCKSQSSIVVSQHKTAVRADIFFFTASGKPISCPASTPVHLAHTGNCQPWKKKLLSGR